MGKRKTISFMIGIYLSAITLPIQADRYKVLIVNGFGDIHIGEQVAKYGVIFDDLDKIQWSNKKQGMRIKNIDKEEANLFYAIYAEEVQAKPVTLKDYIAKTVKTKTGSTKGMGGIERQNTFWLLDSLAIPTEFSISEPCTFDAVWTDGTDTIQYRLPVFQYKGKIVLDITPKIFQGRHPKNPIEIHIKKTDHRGTYRYRCIWIKRIPLSPEDE